MKFDEKYFIKKLKELLDIDSITGQRVSALRQRLLRRAEYLSTSAVREQEE